MSDPQKVDDLVSVKVGGARIVMSRRSYLVVDEIMDRMGVDKNAFLADLYCKEIIPMQLEKVLEAGRSSLRELPPSGGRPILRLDDTRQPRNAN